MTWTATESQPRQQQNGRLYVWFRFSDGSAFFDPEPFVSSNPPPGWPQSLVDAKLAELNGFDPALLTQGANVPPPKPPDPPTQDQLDLAAFAAICQQIVTIKTALNTAATLKTVTKFTQADLASKYDEMKAAYKDQDDYIAITARLQ